MKPKSPPKEDLDAWTRWILPDLELQGQQPDHALKSGSKQQPPPDKKQIGQHPSDLNPDDHQEVKPLTAQELEAIRTAASEDGYQEGLQQGHSEGFEQGRAEGYQAGFTAGEEDVKASLTRLTQICRTLLAPIPEQDQALEDALLAMVVQISTQVVKAELKLDSSSLIDVVREALTLLNPGNKRLKIHLNEVDFQMIQRYMSQLDDWDGSWRIQIHPTITPGGCIIETDTSLVDARAEKRLAGLVQQVYQKKFSATDKSESSCQVEQMIGEIEPFDIAQVQTSADIDLDQLSEQKQPDNSPKKAAEDDVDGSESTN